ncbi:hypothetical protein [Bifidobacterium vansinderenii]|uniref:Uncharacterized protein n=1 Tax=Bifidobacterium vansinderenii TaxID=1984871 RepID=A0A229VXS6_9BIFI|nr:hypothetical protein [Bifidobacterium vansinderenii]OXN00412.1 hypothetical protein Tam10B_1282 [Bifidobacterium vansinderenii]
MAKGWDYAELSQWAAKNGGPQAAVELLKKAAYRDGSSDAWSAARIVIAGAGAACLIIGGVAVKYGPGAIDAVKRQLAILKEPKITDEQRAEAEKQIIEAIEKNPAPDDDDAGTDPSDDAGTSSTSDDNGTEPDEENGDKEPTDK